MTLRKSSLFVAALLFAAAPSPAKGCLFPQPVRVRSSLPSDGDTDVPTSIRVRVTYATGADAEIACGVKPPAPTIRLASTGRDGGAPDAGAPSIDGGVPLGGQWIKATDGDPHVATVFEFRPSQPLPPHTTIELVDAFPTTCDCGDKGCVAQPPASAFARFTTGAGPDTTKPTYSGLIGTGCTLQFCAAIDTSCCGPFDHHDYIFYSKRDEADDHLEGVHLYVRADGAKYDFTHPIGPLTLSDPDDSPLASAWDMKLTPGTWHAIARAFDTSGNEDDNLAEVSFVFPLAKDVLCATLPDGGYPDLSSPPDAVTASPDIAMAADLGGAAHGAGCKCTVGGSHRSPLTTAAALLLIATLAMRRRLRPRSRRGGRAGKV